MTYLLDSNIIILMLKSGGPAGRRAAQRLAQQPAREVAVSAVVEAELWHGAEKYAVPTARRTALTAILSPHLSLAFDSQCVPHYATIRHHLETRGEIIGGNDLMIAATALAHGLTLITHNSAEFARVPGLKWEDWA